ncbi:hypothetical protein HN388_06005 [bacterium]|jgi:hypothetical protein|nr:hypothetical protein [bacterium]MBT4292111.1 hypothetical protein [bacterium]
MKKLTILLAVMAVVLLASGVVFAEEPKKGCEDACKTETLTRGCDDGGTCSNLFSSREIKEFRTQGKAKAEAAPACPSEAKKSDCASKCGSAAKKGCSGK